MPSRVRKPCTWEAYRLRGSPASTTSTRRRARPSTRAADNPAGPPPTTTTSYVSCSVTPPRYPDRRGSHARTTGRACRSPRDRRRERGFVSGSRGFLGGVARLVVLRRRAVGDELVEGVLVEDRDAQLLG